jgi:L,D-transpeptidase ErfK/SrfK
MLRFNTQALISFLLLAFSLSAQSLTLPLKNSNLVGEIKTVLSKKGETLTDVGQRYDMGAQEMILANPEANPYKRLQAGSKIIIPSQFILPNTPKKGLVINLAELRLYYYPKNSNIVITQPVGIGKEHNWQTPVGQTRIIKKEINPTWRPTSNVRAEAAKNGTPIPNAFPPGPLNPLGKYILRLAWPTYLIHGTNRPEGVGKRVSAGCLRLYPNDIEKLYDEITNGTPVTVINEPFKVGWTDNSLYFEAHPPLEETKSQYQDNLADIVHLIKNKTNLSTTFVQWTLIQKAAQAHSGLPVQVGMKT